MSWLAFALCGPILWAISTHLDKYLVERYFKDADVIVLLVFTALMGVVLMPVIAWFEPGVFQRDLTSIVLMLLSGLFYMIGITFYLRALQGHDASMVAPFFQWSPMFGYVLAYLVLGETFTGTSFSAARSLSAASSRYRSARGRKRERFRWQLAALMLCAGFVLSLSTLIFKAFAAEGRVLGNRILDVRRRGAVRRRLSLHRPLSAAVPRSAARNGGALIALNASNELINLGGGLANRYALIFAPLAIVQAVGSTTTLFVFVIGVLLTLLFPASAARTSRPANSRRRAVAAVLVAIGVTLVSR